MVVLRLHLSSSLNEAVETCNHGPAINIFEGNSNAYPISRMNLKK